LSRACWRSRFSAPAASLQQIKDSGSIRIATANEIPYGYMEGDTAVGLGPSVAKKVLAEMGITDIDWTVTPFGSLIPSLKADRVDMVAASQAFQPQRCSQVDYSRLNSTYGEGLLVKKGNPEDIHGYDSFVNDSSLKFGIVSGANQLGFAQKLGMDSGQIVSLGAAADATSAVATGRIDALAHGRSPGPKERPGGAGAAVHRSGHRRRSPAQLGRVHLCQGQRRTAQGLQRQARGVPDRRMARYSEEVRSRQGFDRQGQRQNHRAAVLGGLTARRPHATCRPS